MNKKLLRIFLLVPIFLITMLFGFACGDNSLKSISLSIDNCAKEGGYYILQADSRYEVKATLTEGYSVTDLTWKSDNQSIARVYLSGSKAMIRTGSAGRANISASYKNKNGSTIIETLKISVVTAATTMSFDQSKYDAIYTGIDIKDNYKIIQDTEDNPKDYVYTYYSLEKEADVTEVIDAGTYQITCKEIIADEEGREPEICTTMLVVGKATLNLTSSNYQITYGEDLPEDLFTQGSVPEDFMNNADVGKVLKGIGRESEIRIGKYVETTIATNGADAATYPTNIHFELIEEFKGNYNEEAIIKTGTLRISKKQVVLSIRNQTINYGGAIVNNNFDLYSYEQYLEAGKDITQITPLGNETINFSGNIYLNQPSYKLNGEKVEFNSVGVLDVIANEDGSFGSYELCYENASVITSNLSIVEKLNGKLTINPREVTIVPTTGQTKVYGEVDPTSLKYSVVTGSFINKDNIPNFLFVDYRMGDTTGEGNYRANVNKYYYDIDNSGTNNYKVLMSSEAVEDTTPGADNTNKIMFEVIPCGIVIELEDKPAKYKKAFSATPTNPYSHTLSYYATDENDKEPDYKTTVKSIKVNNVEIIGNAAGVIGTNTVAADFETSGKIMLKTGEIFKFGVALEKVDSTEYHLSYKTKLSSVEFEILSDVANFNISLVSSQLNLSKLTITIVPKETAGISTKTYDAKSGDTGLPAGFGRDYLVVGQLEEGITIENILSNYDSVLTLKHNNAYLKKDENGVDVATSEFKHAGEYRIGLYNSLLPKDGMDYYDIQLDTSKPYYFTIDKYDVLLTPSLAEDNVSNQSKIYASDDPEILFTTTQLPEEEVSHYGALSREAGENVGNYAITLGTLSLGESYNIILNPDTVYFSILPRKVIIEPISYVTTYGDNYPQTIGYNETIESGFNDALIVAPTYTGAFALNGSKVGGNYPVKIQTEEDGSETVIAYNILQGDFACNENYVIEFVSTSTYLVNKRPIAIDIISQQKEDRDGLQTEIVLEKNYYTISNILDEATTQLNLTLLPGDVSYNVKSFTLTVTESSTDVSHCYAPEIGKDIVYNIDVKIIYLAIMDKANLSSTVNLTYSGAERKDEFVLVCQTEGYEISTDSDFDFKYDSGQIKGATPKNVGSYITYIDLTRTNAAIVIKNNKHTCTSDCGETCEDKEITFASLEEVSRNHIISISNYGYLNIARANINYVEDKLGFSQDLEYGGTSLTNLLTTYLDESNQTQKVFYGVGGETIELKTFTNNNGLNFSYSSANSNLSTLEANRTYPINVTIQAVKSVGYTQEIDNNYNSLNLNIPLHVKPRGLTVLAAGFEASYETLTANSVTYDGRTKPMSLKLTVDGQEEGEVTYATTYSYMRLKTSYSSSTKAIFEYYGYDATKQLPNIDGGLQTQSFSSSGLQNISTLQLINYNGADYLMVNNMYCLVLEAGDVSTPVNAGVYVCLANCESKTNYAFSVVDAEGNQVLNTRTVYCHIYEIEKSSNIAVENWKDKFYYTTKFDLVNQNLLPFEYEMTPNFKDQVVYSMDEPADWPASNILNVGNYSVTLMFENENYYFNKPFDFEVEKLRADFVFPTIKTYLYKGKDQPIIDFFSNIRILEKDKDGNTVNSFYYTYGDENEYLKFEFYKPGEEEPLDYIPWEVLPDGEEYTLKAIYGGDGSNYYGEGEFKYSIIKKSYGGTVKFQSTTITYNPTYTPAELYETIYSKMFAIGLEDGYKVKLTHATYEDVVLDPTVEYEDINTTWVKEILQAGIVRLKILVQFEDGITADFTGEASLTINKLAVTQGSTGIDDSKTGAKYIYNGYPVYNPLMFNGASLDPNDFLTKTKETYANDRYIYYVTKTVNGDGDIVMNVKDNLNNDIFDLTYSYEAYFESLNGYAKLSGIPIDPMDEAYHVKYTFQFYSNYFGSSIEISEKTFRIEKVQTLYISFDNWNITYDGANFRPRFEESQIMVRNSEYVKETNMKVTVRFSLGTTEYVNTDGVCLYVYFTDASGNKTENLTNAGQYLMYVSLFYSEGYDTSIYFNNVKFGTSDDLTIDNFKFNEDVDPSGAQYGYKQKMSKLVNIGKIKYNITNWSAALEFGTTVSGDEVRYEDGRLLIKDIHSLTALGPGITAVSIYKYENGSYAEEPIITLQADGLSSFNFSSLEIFDTDDKNTYAFGFTCDNNHEASYIDFILSRYQTT